MWGRGKNRRHGGGPKCRKNCGNLNLLAEGEGGVIVSVPERSLLAPLGLRPGKRVRVRARGRFGGPVIAETNGRKVALSQHVAEQIELENGDPDEQA